MEISESWVIPAFLEKEYLVYLHYDPLFFIDPVQPFSLSLYFFIIIKNIEGLIHMESIKWSKYRYLNIIIYFPSLPYSIVM